MTLVGAPEGEDPSSGPADFDVTGLKARQTASNRPSPFVGGTMADRFEASVVALVDVGLGTHRPATSIG